MAEYRYRMMPNSEEYEHAVLSLLLEQSRDMSEKSEVFDNLNENDFYHMRNREIFKACHTLYQRKQPIDIVSVPDIIGDAFPMAATYVAEVADSLPATDIQHYCDTLRDYSKVRAAIILMERNLDDFRATNGGNVHEAGERLDEFQKEILLIDNRGRSKFYKMAALIGDAIDRYRQMNASCGLDQLRTGFGLIDDIVAFRGARLVIIAARPSIGKTAFMLSIVRNMILRYHIPAIFELEMDKDDVVDRLVSMQGDINLLQLVYGSGPSSDSWAKIINAGKDIYDWPLMIDDEGGLHITELRRRIRYAKKCGAQIVFIDQLSQIRGPGRSMYEQNTAIVQELSRLKKEVSIPIVLLCQISRKQDESSAKAPALHMLKSTGAIEEEADVVMLLDRPYFYTREEEDKHKAIVDVAKNRHGSPGVIELEWVPSRAMFKNKL